MANNKICGTFYIFFWFLCIQLTITILDQWWYFIDIHLIYFTFPPFLIFFFAFFPFELPTPRAWYHVFLLNFPTPFPTTVLILSVDLCQRKGLALDIYVCGFYNVFRVLYIHTYIYTKKQFLYICTLHIT